MTVDFFDKEVDPAEDIDLVLLSLWGMTEDDLAENLNKDNLPTDRNKAAITTYPDGTYTLENLLDFNSFNNPVPVDRLWEVFDTSTPDYEYPPKTHTFLVIAQTGTDPGRDARMLGFFRLDPDSSIFLRSEWQ